MDETFLSVEGAVAKARPRRLWGVVGGCTDQTQKLVSKHNTPGLLPGGVVFQDRVVLGECQSSYLKISRTLLTWLLDFAFRLPFITLIFSVGSLLAM